MVAVNAILDKMSSQETLALLATALGYKAMPVDIETFLNDPYYLGNSCGINPLTGQSAIFPKWHEALHQIYPDAIRTSTFVANAGAIGTGKSTVGKIILMYDIYKITMLKNAAAYFGLIQKYFHFVIFNLTKLTAEKMVKEMKAWMDASPYFQEQFADPESVIHWISLDDASRMDDIISNDVISIIYSEMNFVRNLERGIQLIDQGISRIESRFQKGFGLFNHIILDSSDTSIEAPVPQFLIHHPRGRETLVFKFAIWDVKPEMYFHMSDPITGKKTFTVYKGDSETPPCIVDDTTKTEDMDPDRFMEVPLELKTDFEANIELQLNEKAGVTVETTTQYFKATNVIPHMTYDMMMPEIITIDFFGEESYIPYFEDLINKLPHDRCLFGSVDLGLSHDRAGFSLGYIENLNPIDNDGVVSFDPKVVVPCAVAFSRYVGQETSIDKITQLIVWIHSQIPFYKFTMDTYQSAAIKQKLINTEINAEFLSVDRTVQHHKIAKQMIYQGKVVLPKSTLLKNELINLVDLGKKIDHHATKNANGDIGSDSKDVADSVVRLLSTMHNATADAMEPPLISRSAIQKYNEELISEWVDTQRKQKFDMLYGTNYGLTAELHNLAYN